MPSGAACTLDLLCQTTSCLPAARIKITQRNYISPLKGRGCNIPFETLTIINRPTRNKRWRLSLPAHCPMDFKKDVGKTFQKCRKTHLENLTHFTRWTRHTSSPTKIKNCSRRSPMTARLLMPFVTQQIPPWPRRRDCFGLCQPPSGVPGCVRLCQGIRLK